MYFPKCVRNKEARKTTTPAAAAAAGVNVQRSAFVVVGYPAQAAAPHTKKQRKKLLICLLPTEATADPTQLLYVRANATTVEMFKCH